MSKTGKSAPGAPPPTRGSEPEPVRVLTNEGGRQGAVWLGISVAQLAHLRRLVIAANVQVAPQTFGSGAELEGALGDAHRLVVVRAAEHGVVPPPRSGAEG